MACALLQDDLDDVILVLCVEFCAEDVFRRCVKVSLGAVPIKPSMLAKDKNNNKWELESVLVRSEYLEGRDKVSHGDALVALPLLVSVGIVDKDNVVFVLALVVDLGLNSFAASHCEEMGVFEG